MKTITFLLSLLFLSATISMAQTVYYVDGDQSISGNGTSWTAAFKTIQEGIDAAHNSLGNPASETAQVWVRQGTYYIYSNSTENTVTMQEGVQIYGGFNGTENVLEERNYQTNETILSGYKSSGSSNQVKHVVTAFGEETATDVWNDWTNGVLDGFTVTGGKISGPPGKNAEKVVSPEEILASGNETAGAGILIFKCAPTIRNCKIMDNESGKGGGMYIMSATEVNQVTVPKAEIINCEFVNNLAFGRGGGISIDLYSEPFIDRCKFIGNTCTAKGGGVYIDWICPQPVFVNCLFAENYASRAGAMGVDGSSSPMLINCTVTNNSSNDVGAGIYTGSYNPDGTDSNEPVLINCIVSGNTADWGGPVDLRIWHDNYFFVSHSILGSGFTSFGDGISYETPVFENITTGNYELNSNSPGIDGGVQTDPLDIHNYIPTIDINGNPRDENPDMGCFENDGVLTSGSGLFVQPKSFRIYPNPAKDNLYITYIGDNFRETEIDIFDGFGQFIRNKSFLRSTQIDISDLKQGIYFVRVSNNKKSETYKILKFCK